MKEKTVIVQIRNERARVYEAGGVAFECSVRGIGWVIDSEPSDEIIDYACSIHNKLCPSLPSLDVELLRD